MPPRSTTRRGSRTLSGLGDFFDTCRSGALPQGQHTQAEGKPMAGLACSQTLVDLRRRILEGVMVGKGGGGSSDVLGAHRKRAWEMAFGQPGGDGVEVSTMELSLICPYSRSPLQHPVRSRDCRHLQCCDLASWIVLLAKQRSMRDPKAPCPVCEQRVLASTLEMDYWQLHVLSQMPPGTHMLLLDADGSYRSGDVSRDQKREQAMEIIESTQAEDGGGGSGLCTLSSPDHASSVQMQPDVGVTLVKRERPSDDGLELPSLELCSTFSRPTQDDDDVVVACYVDGVQGNRVLPGRSRMWVAHCPNCSSTLLQKSGGGGTVECCDACGGAQYGWTFLRVFPGTALSLELTGDGTLILCGADALAPHLFRAGFSRAMFFGECNMDSRRMDAGLWYTSATLTRYELDFLEACCERLACGESVEDIPVVPALFRIPRRRRRPLGTEAMSTQMSFF